jgi:hypothetical protein
VATGSLPEAPMQSPRAAPRVGGVIKARSRRQEIHRGSKGKTLNKKTVQLSDKRSFESETSV